MLSEPYWGRFLKPTVKARCEFATVTQRSGIYTFRHHQEGDLYIGKAVNIRQRLRGGHKALEIEARMIQALRPRYNIRIRQPE